MTDILVGRYLWRTWTQQLSGIASLLAVVVVVAAPLLSGPRLVVFALVSTGVGLVVSGLTVLNAPIHALGAQAQLPGAFLDDLAMRTNKRTALKVSELGLEVLGDPLVRSDLVMVSALGPMALRSAAKLLGRGVTADELLGALGGEIRDGRDPLTLLALASERHVKLRAFDASLDSLLG